MCFIISFTFIQSGADATKLILQPIDDNSGETKGTIV